MHVRRLTHDELIRSRTVGPGPYSGWLEVPGGAVPAGAVPFVECRVVFGPAGVSLAVVRPEWWPDGDMRLVVPCPGGLLWAGIAALQGAGGRFVAPAPVCWFRANRRTGYRVPLARPVRADVAGTAMPATLLDVSVTGACVRLPLERSAVREGMRLEIRLPVAGDPWAGAEAVRAAAAAAGSVRVALRWVDLQASVEQRLASYVFAREREKVWAARGGGGRTGGRR